VDPQTFRDQVRQMIRQERLIAPGERLLVGVSGGADSLALLWALQALRADLGCALHVVYVDHGLRPEAPAEAAFVADLAQQWGLPCTSVRVDVPALQRQRHLSLEEAARLARYGAFARLAQSLDAQAVAVGHTRDDQVETVLLHWLRGTGLHGLQGMAPATDLTLSLDGQRWTLRVIRPLLSLGRADTQALCQTIGLTPREDPTNQERRYLRNRVRHELLPLLEQYNPGIRASLLRLAALARDDLAVITATMSRWWADHVQVQDRIARWERAPWLALSPALQRAVLRQAARTVGGDLLDLTMVHIEAARRLIVTGRTGATVHWPGGLQVRIRYNRVEIAPARPEIERLPLAGVRLAVPGATAVPGTDWWVVARVQDRPCPDWTDPWHADLDGERAGETLIVRRRRPGDRFIPLGMTGLKKLQDFLVDAKVPRDLRDLVPVVDNGQQIVWVAGQRLDERVKITPTTRRVLCLRFVELPLPERSDESIGQNWEGDNGRNDGSEGHESR